MGDWSKSENRVLRGGSWNNNGRWCRSANRNGNHPGNRNDNIGFRLARAQQGWTDLLTRPSSGPVAAVDNVPWPAKTNRLSGMLVDGKHPNRTLAGELLYPDAAKNDELKSGRVCQSWLRGGFSGLVS